MTGRRGDRRRRATDDAAASWPAGAEKFLSCPSASSDGFINIADAAIGPDTTGSRSSIPAGDLSALLTALSELR